MASGDVLPAGGRAVNPLTDWLASRFPEFGPEEFYRDLFPEGSIASLDMEPGGYSPILVRVLRGADGAEKAERHRVLDDLGEIGAALALDPCLDGVTDLLSPVSYAGRRPMLDRAHELFALVFDLDGVRVGDGGPSGLESLFYQMEEVPGVRGTLVPRPTFVVSSGTGLHLYYLLDRPVRMWPDVCERLRLFRDSLTRRLWNPYVTRLSDKPQLEGVVQSFRMVGSRSKSGDQVVRAFLTGLRVTMAGMDLFVPEGCRVSPLLGQRRTLAEARGLWPEWDPDWRRRVTLAPKSPWRVKRALFDWWRRRVVSGEPFVGNRYWCVFVAACLAAKCPEVTYDELEAWAYRVRPLLDSLGSTPEEAFTEEDVSCALGAYGNPRSVKLRRDKIAEKTQLPMPVNKRNGRTRVAHIIRQNRIFDMDVADGEPEKRGRPKGSGTKADVIRSYAAEHPDASQRQIAAALGVSKTTVNKWLAPGWREEYEASRAPRITGGRLTVVSDRGIPMTVVRDRNGRGFDSLVVGRPGKPPKAAN